MLPPLRTARPDLAPMTAGEVDVLHGLLVQPEVRRFLCDDTVLPHAVVAGMLDKAVALRPRGLGLWSVRLSAGGWIGCIGLQPVEGAALAARPDFAGEIEPLVALHPSVQERGLATEALAAALGHAFGALGRARLVALVDAPNLASLALMRRAGFTELGEAPGSRFPLVAWEIRRPEGAQRPVAATWPSRTTR